ncbi:efflux RND transporter periplasmic adaptor subunit [Chromobacterium piscinae]|uniref:efflux RND transporter periplasmic adaptor subunit n=1 Tax=Chromobacterium piscinae TaxID=686831 RepID=UPI0032618E26
MNYLQACRYGGACALAVSILAGCTQPAPQDAPAAIPVAAATLAPAPLQLSDDLPGRVAAVRVAEIRPQVGGIVLRRLFEQGSEVKAGQPLFQMFQINPAPLKADADTAAAALQRAEAALTRARAQTARLQPLVETDAVSRQVFDDAVSLRDQAAADVAQARAALARRRLARIQQIDQVYVDVRQPAAALESVRRTLAAQPEAADRGLPVALLRNDGKPYDETGRILFSGINVDAGTGDVLLRVLVDNPNRQLLPGMFVRARVPRASYAGALTVPQQAVVRIGGKPQVWTVDAKSHARLAAVELGELAERRYRIQAGLKAGQKVVVEGMERLSEGALVAAAPARR